MSQDQPSVARPEMSWGARLRATGLIPLLMAALICGAVVGGMVWGASANTARAVAAHRHHVQATTTGTATAPPAQARDTVGLKYTAPAVWNYPSGTRRSGTVPVPAATAAGGRVRVWVDDTGRPAAPPAGAPERFVTALAGGLWTAGVLGGMAIGGRRLVRGRVAPARLVAWEREWEEVEPVWSGRLHHGDGPPKDAD